MRMHAIDCDMSEPCACHPDETGGYNSRQRMNDYVGSGIYADVRWLVGCGKSGKHLLGLMSHECVKCGVKAIVTYETPLYMRQFDNL